MSTKPRFISTIFSGGGKEEVAAPDIYKDTVSADSAVSSYYSTTLPDTEKVGNTFQTSRFDPRKVVQLISLKDGIGLDKDVLSRRMEDATGYRFDASKTYQQQIKADALTAFAKKTGLGSTGLIDSNGEINPLLTGDEVSARDFFSLVKDVTGSDLLKSFPDIQAQIGMIGTLVGAAMAMGLPDAIDDLLKKIDNEEARKEVLIAGLERSAKAGDLGTLYKIKSYIGAKDMYARCPKLVTYVMQGYIFPTSGDQPKYSDVYSKMVGLFNEVDANWDRDTRDGAVITKLASFVTASTATKTVFSTVGNEDANGVNHKAAVLMASNYRTDVLKNIARQNFPKAGIS